jgi:hypothetical protein
VLRIEMLTAIQFNDEFCARAVEIHDVGTDCLLPAKAKTGELFAPKQCPELALCLRNVSSELTSKFCFQGLATWIVLRARHADNLPSP